MTWAGKEVALGIAVTGICLYNPDECRSPGHSSGSGCAGPAIWSDQAPADESFNITVAMVLVVFTNYTIF